MKNIHHDIVLQRISEKIEYWIQKREDCLTSIPGLALFRRDQINNACPCLYEAGIFCVTQGAKKMITDQDSYQYDPQNMLITALPIPASTQVLKAEKITPCLGFSLRLDRQIIAEQLSHLYTVPSESIAHGSCAATEPVTNDFLTIVERLFLLLDEPESIPVLAPLIVRELHYRLLTSNVAWVIRYMVSTGSARLKILEAIHWLRTHLAQSMRVGELADYVHMSPSSLYSHFRCVTGHSPLQYQKLLRVHEARRLMLAEHMNAETAAYQVGYESSSHFSRDYKKLFSVSPKKSIKQICDV